MGSFETTAMKKTVRTRGGGWKMPTEEEVEVAQILLSLPKLFKKSELIDRFSFTWGKKNKRSVPESSPEKMTAVVEADTRPSSSSAMNVFKRKEKDDLVEVYNRMHQAMETQHQKLDFEKHSRNMEDFHMWNCNPMKPVDDQQLCHQQITMFAPPTPHHDHRLPQLVDPDSDKLMGVSIGDHPRVKIHGEIYDFMGLSQPLDRSKCFVKGDDLRFRNAADARKRRMLRMKENKNSLSAMKLSRNFRR